MDTQGPEFVDPADQWVLDPATGTYQLRLDPPPQPRPQPQSEPRSQPEQHPYQTPADPPDPPAPARAEHIAAPRPAPGPGSRRARTDQGRRRAAGAGQSGRRRAKPRRSGRRPAVLWTAVGAGVAVVAGGIGLLSAGGSEPGIRTVDVGDAGAAALSASGPMNVLLIGTGDGGTGQTGAASAILVHLAANHENATALAVPENLVTSIPGCPTGKGPSGVAGSPQGKTSPTVRDSLGGGRDPGCVMRLVAQVTGLKVDHFLLADQAALKTVATAVGGLDGCLTQVTRAGQSPPEPNRVDAREQLLAGLVRAVAPGGSRDSGGSTGPAAGKDRTATLVRTASTALTMDTPLGSVAALSGLGALFGTVDPAHFTFTTLPVLANPADPAHGTVVLDRARAAQLLSLIRNDVSLSQGPVQPDPKLVGPKATPHNTRVLVYNGTGVFGASQDVLNWLQNDEGVNRSTNGGDAPSHAARTTLKYAPNQADQARSLAAMMGLPASALIPGTVNAAPRANMTLTLGADYTAPGTPIGPPTTPPKGLDMLTAAAGGCGA
ncbi:LCP family protein [Streptomyces polygonati]|uniref:LCP family protein n=1 Tax=Streptomyces polygonati TaxID=1617087 RepID=A0ABV8HSG2_9ACTN